MTADTAILVIDITLKYNHSDCGQKLTLPKHYLCNTYATQLFKFLIKCFKDTLLIK